MLFYLRFCTCILLACVLLSFSYLHSTCVRPTCGFLLAFYLRASYLRASYLHLHTYIWHLGAHIIQVWITVIQHITRNRRPVFESRCWPTIKIFQVTASARPGQVLRRLDSPTVSSVRMFGRLLGVVLGRVVNKGWGSRLFLVLTCVLHVSYLRCLRHLLALYHDSYLRLSYVSYLCSVCSLLVLLTCVNILSTCVYTFFYLRK